MLGVGAPLVTASAPLGFFSIEFAGEPFLAQMVVDGWKTPPAQFVLGLAFAFLISFYPLLTFGCLWAADVMEGYSGFLHETGILLAWTQAVAAMLNLAENVLLVPVLIGGNFSLARAVLLCAAAKYAIILAALIFMAYAAIAAALARSSGLRKAAYRSS